MRLGTRLLLLLLPAVVGIMALSAGLALRARQESLARDTRLETQAYATALALAFDQTIRSVERDDIQAVINRVSRAATVYGVLVYDGSGRLLFASAPLRAPDPAPAAALARVLREGGTPTLERRIEGQRVFSVLRALHGPGGRVVGALEVAQPLSFIEEEIAKVRWRYLLTTVTLLGAISLITLWIVRRTITRPLGRLVEASRALERGDLAHRIEVGDTSGELTQVAHAFNRMAASLGQAQSVLARDTEERLQLERRLRESEKMVTIGNLAAGLAHEIAAPLNVISGRAEMMLKRESEPGGRERPLRIIVQQINRITTIVRNLLDFARRREVRRQPTDLAAVLHGVGELLEEELARAGVRVVHEGAGPVWIDGDPDLLHQVFVNLYLNAVQAMETSAGEHRLIVRLGRGGGAADPGALALVELEDTGPGIAPDMLERIFDPFVTTKLRGTGLGLVVARSIVQEHGGELTAANAGSGRGAVFRVRLPSLRPAAAPAEVAGV